MEMTLKRKLYVAVKSPYQSTYQIISAGIVDGSASISEILCSEENIVFGNYNSTKFEVTIDTNRINKNIYINTGCDIRAYFENYSIADSKAGIAIVNEAIVGVGEASEDNAVVGTAVVGKAIVSKEGSYYPSGDEPAKQYLFTGCIESIKRESSMLSSTASNVIHIIAYDKLYFFRDQNSIKDSYGQALSLSYWWKSNWSGVSSTEPIPIYLYELRNSLCNFLGLPVVQDPDYDDPNFGLINNGFLIYPKGQRDSNYDYIISDLPNDITISQIMFWICELQCTFPHITGDGLIEFIDLRSTSVHNIENMYEYGSSEIDVNSPNRITDVAVFLNDSIFYMKGDDRHYPDERHPFNRYKIIDNFFIESLYSLSKTYPEHIYTQVIKDAVDDIYNLISSYIYSSTRSASFKMIYSDLDIHLGDKIVYYTKNGISYSTVVTSNNLSGTLLVDQTLETRMIDDYETEDLLAYSSHQTPDSMYNESFKPYYWSNSSMSQVSIEHDTTKNIGEFELPSSTGVIHVTARFSTDSSGIRRCWLANSSGGTYISPRTYVSQNAINGANTVLQMIVPVNITTKTRKFYIVAKQNSGSTITVTPQVAYFGIVEE